MKKLFFILLLTMTANLYAAEPPCYKSFQDADINNPKIDFLKTDIESLKREAYNVYLTGNYEKAAQIYLYVLQHKIDDRLSLYNLACSYGLLKKPELSAQFLELAVNAGYDNWDFIKADTDFNNVKNDPAFKEKWNSIKKSLDEIGNSLGELNYVKSQSIHKARIHYPINYDKTKKYTVLIALHGFGGSADRISRRFKDFKNEKYVFISIQAPYHVRFSNDGFSWALGNPGDELNDFTSNSTVQYIRDAVLTYKEMFNSNDVYLIGFSQGARFSYMAGIKNYDIIKGIACFGGLLSRDYLKEEGLKKGKSLKVLIGHGTDDQIIGFDEALRAKAILDTYGYDYELYEFDGGHVFSDNEIKEIMKWLEKIK